MSSELILNHSLDAIQRGSKTFSFASRFFSRSNARDAALLYSWCRHCDDSIDQVDPALRRQALIELEEKTKSALAGNACSEPAFLALQQVVERHAIPHKYPLDLLEGMRMDVEFKSFADFDELHRYCYHVAGVVGLMMAHIMGVSNETALRNACDLGMAMQLTNIARDVREDASLGRCYLPLEVLAEYGLDQHSYTLDNHRSALFRAVTRLLERADFLYRFGETGTRHLDRVSALVILTARFCYARIGHKILRAGPDRWWSNRQFTNGADKLRCFLRALGCWSLQTFRPSAWRWRRIPLRGIYDFKH